MLTLEGSRGRGGLIAIGGPPFGGKGVLAAELVDWLPRVFKLELGDDLAGKSVVLGGARADVLLAEAREIWLRAESAFPPTILLTARFGSRARRRRARAAARGAGMPFLFVEAQSSRARARERLLARALPEAEARERFKRYRAALQNYLPVSRAEQIALPALRLRRVQSALDAAVARVLEAWSGDE